jgi:hypothetical protein
MMAMILLVAAGCWMSDLHFVCKNVFEWQKNAAVPWQFGRSNPTGS